MHYPIKSPDSHGFLSIVPIAGLVSTTAFMALAPDQSCKALDFQGGFQEFGALNGEFMANIQDGAPKIVKLPYKWFYGRYNYS